MTRQHVTLDMQPLRAMMSEVRSDLRSASGSGPIRRTMLHQMGIIYLEFVKRRFVKFSRGGGDWKPLAQSTIRSRRRGGKKRGGVNTVKVRTKKTGGKVAILRDTSTLLAALDVGNPGNLFKHITNGVKVGFAGNKRHPKGKATVADIAAFHNRGGPGGKPPKRRILAEPDAKTNRQFDHVRQLAVQKLLNKHQVRK